MKMSKFQEATRAKKKVPEPPESLFEDAPNPQREVPSQPSYQPPESLLRDSSSTRHIDSNDMPTSGLLPYSKRTDQPVSRPSKLPNSRQVEEQPYEEIEVKCDLESHDQRKSIVDRDAKHKYLLHFESKMNEYLKINEDSNKQDKNKNKDKDKDNEPTNAVKSLVQNVRQGTNRVGSRTANRCVLLDGVARVGKSTTYHMLCSKEVVSHRRGDGECYPNCLNPDDDTDKCKIRNGHPSDKQTDLTYKLKTRVPNAAIVKHNNLEYNIIAIPGATGTNQEQEIVNAMCKKTAFEENERVKYVRVLNFRTLDERAKLLEKELLEWTLPQFENVEFLTKSLFLLFTAGERTMSVATTLKNLTEECPAEVKDLLNEIVKDEDSAKPNPAAASRYAVLFRPRDPDVMNKSSWDKQGKEPYFKQAENRSVLSAILDNEGFVEANMDPLRNFVSTPAKSLSKKSLKYVTEYFYTALWDVMEICKQPKNALDYLNKKTGVNWERWTDGSEGTELSIPRISENESERESFYQEMIQKITSNTTNEQSPIKNIVFALEQMHEKLPSFFLSFYAEEDAKVFAHKLRGLKNALYRLKGLLLLLAKTAASKKMIVDDKQMNEQNEHDVKTNHEDQQFANEINSIIQSFWIDCTSVLSSHKTK